MSITLDGDNLTTTGVINSGTAVASTSGTSINFTGIPAGVKRITVMFNGVSTNGTSLYQIQIGSGSIVASGYKATSAYISGTSVSGSIVSTTGFAVLNSVGAVYSYSGLAILAYFGGNIWTMSSTLSIDSGANAIFFCGGVASALSGTLDRVRITTVNGTDTFDAGSINILYE